MGELKWIGSDFNTSKYYNPTTYAEKKKRALEGIDPKTEYVVVDKIYCLHCNGLKSLDSQMQKNDKFLTLTTDLFNLFQSMNNKKLLTSFNNYIKEDNAEAKKEAYLTYLNRKIDGCRRKIDLLECKYNTRRLWHKKDTVENPRTRRLIFWRGRLGYWERRLDNAEKDVRYAKVRYMRITYQSIFGTSEARLREGRDMGFHTAAHNVGIFVKKVLLIFAFGFAASLGFGFETVEWSLYFVYKMAVRLFQVGMALYTGISDADKFVAGDMCDALRNRIAYVQSFRETLPTEKTGTKEVERQQ